MQNKSLSLILKQFLKQWNSSTQESIEFKHTKLSIDFNMGSYNPYQINIQIPDATRFESNHSILCTCLDILTAEQIGFDDYDEIDYNASIETRTPNGESQEGHIPVPVTVTIQYTLIN